MPSSALADGLAQSPQETRLRLLLHRSALPDPIAQFKIVVDGRFVRRPDFAWPDRKVALEYDGLWHGEPGEFVRDQQRLDRLQASGWRVVFVTAADLRDTDRLLALIADGRCALVVLSTCGEITVSAHRRPPHSRRSRGGAPVAAGRSPARAPTCEEPR